MIDISKNDDEFKNYKNNEQINKILSSRNKIHLINPRYSFKIDYDSKNNKFTKRFNSPRFNRSTNLEFPKINSSLKNLPLIETPKISLLSTHNKNVSVIDLKENELNNNTLSPKTKNELNVNNKNYFGYGRKGRVEALDLKLHKDSIEEQEKEYQRLKDEMIKQKKESFFNIIVNKNKPLNKDLYNSEKKNNDKNLKLINFDDDDLNHLKNDKELNLTLRQMNLLNNDANMFYHKYKLANNNLFGTHEKKLNLLPNKNKYKIKKAKLFSFSPIAKNGFNILNLFNGKNQKNI